MTTAIQIARPTRVFAEYWPANVLLPDGTVRRKVRVYLTDTGAHLFYTKPTDELAPGFTAEIDFAATTSPNIHAHNIGVDIVLAGEGEPTDRTLVITPTGGCGCGNTLKNWVPSWSHTLAPWPSA